MRRSTPSLLLVPVLAVLFAPALAARAAPTDAETAAAAPLPPLASEAASAPVPALGAGGAELPATALGFLGGRTFRVVSAPGASADALGQALASELASRGASVAAAGSGAVDYVLALRPAAAGTEVHVGTAAGIEIWHGAVPATTAVALADALAAHRELAGAVALARHTPAAAKRVAAAQADPPGTVRAFGKLIPRSACSAK